MELDELKETLRALEQRLAKESSLNLLVRQEQKGLPVQKALWPLYLLHTSQIALGVFLALLVGPFWVSRFNEPHLLVAGVFVHLYAVAMIALGARTLSLLWSMNFGSPVLAIQEQLARVRRAYVRSGLIVGLPWWFLWLPVAMLLFAMLGVDLYATSSAPGSSATCSLASSACSRRCGSAARCGIDASIRRNRESSRNAGAANGC